MRSIILLALALAIFCGPATAQFAGTGIPVVKDGSGQTIGPVVNYVPPPGSTTSESVHTVVFAGDVPVYIGVNRLGGFFTPGVFFQVFFESTDCSGAPYLGESVPGDFDRVLNVTAIRGIPPTGLEVYAPVDGATLQTGLLRQSGLQSDGACLMFPGGAIDEGLPAVRYQTPFDEPFRTGIGPSIAQAGFSFAVPQLGPAGITLLIVMVSLLTFGALRQQRAG